MIVVREPDEIRRWFIVFWPGSVPGLNRWTRAVPGRFKHVSAFGYSDPCKTWVWYDVGLTGTEVRVLPGTKQSELLLGEWTLGCEVLVIAAGRRPNAVARLGMFCTSAVRHLCAVPGGALLPDGFRKDCLRHGAEVVIHAERAEGPAGPNTDGAADRGGCRERGSDQIEPVGANG